MAPLVLLSAIANKTEVIAHSLEKQFLTLAFGRDFHNPRKERDHHQQALLMHTWTPNISSTDIIPPRSPSEVIQIIKKGRKSRFCCKGGAGGAGGCRRLQAVVGVVKAVNQAQVLRRGAGGCEAVVGGQTAVVRGLVLSFLLTS
ncbi:hypothetical protein TNCV_4524231 [Trichonephila clavipes]|nr:hypothetical protein TNCV_4524231 [Trichonephila clavipes]